MTGVGNVGVYPEPAAKGAAVLGCAALLGYGSLKAAWGLGGTIGVANHAAWQQSISSLAAWQWFIAFWGTVVLDLAAAAILLTLVHSRPPRRDHRRHRVRRGLAWSGCAVLGPAGLIGLADITGPALGLWHREPEPLATWVFAVVYGCFVVLAGSFAVAAWSNRRSFTRAAVPG